MFRVNKLTNLHTRCLNYLDLIQKANRRYEDKSSYLAEYDACSDWSTPIRLMNTREYITDQIKRYINLSDWLVSRYQSVFTELGTENLRRLQTRIKEIDLTLSTNEVNTIDL